MTTGMIFHPAKDCMAVMIPLPLVDYESAELVFHVDGMEFVVDKVIDDGRPGEWYTGDRPILGKLILRAVRRETKGAR